MNPSSSNGIGGAGSIGTGGKDGAPIEWHNETPGERYFGMENVSLFLPSVFRDVVSLRLSLLHENEDCRSLEYNVLTSSLWWNPFYSLATPGSFKFSPHSLYFSALNEEKRGTDRFKSRSK